MKVELLRLETDQVPRRSRDHDATPPARLEGLSQLGDVHLQRLGRRARRVLTPEIRDQAIGRDDLVSVEKERAEERALFGSPKCDRAVLVIAHFERTEDSEVHRSPPA